MTTLKNNLGRLLATITIMLIVSCGSIVNENNDTAEILNVSKVEASNYVLAATPEAVVEKLETYLNTKDMNGILSLYNEESVFVNQPEGEPLIGLNAIRGGFQSVLDMGGQADIKLRSLIQSGNLALVIVDWTSKGIDSEGKAFEFGATATDVLQQGKDGNWLYKIDNAFGVARPDSFVEKNNDTKKSFNTNIAEKLEMYMNTKNMKGILSLYNEESVFVNQPEANPKVGIDAIRDGFQGFLDMGGQSDIQVRNMIQSGNIALVIVDWTFKGVDPEGKAFEFGATATDVIQQDKKGNWLYRIDNAFGVARANQ